MAFAGAATTFAALLAEDVVEVVAVVVVALGGDTRVFRVGALGGAASVVVVLVVGVVEVVVVIPCGFPQFSQNLFPILVCLLQNGHVLVAAVCIGADDANDDFFE